MTQTTTRTSQELETMRRELNREETRHRNAQASETEDLMWKVFLRLTQQAASGDDEGDADKPEIILADMVMAAWSEADEDEGEQSAWTIERKHQQRRKRLRKLALAIGFTEDELMELANEHRPVEAS